MVDNQTMEESSPDEYDEVVITKNMKTVDAFSSHVIPMKMEKAYTGECINVMTQALQTKDGSLPQGLTIQNVYTELRKGSKNTVMVVRNSMAYPQTPNSQKENPSGQSSGHNCGARAASRNKVAGGGG